VDWLHAQIRLTLSGRRKLVETFAEIAGAFEGDPKIIWTDLLISEEQLERLRHAWETQNGSVTTQLVPDAGGGRNAEIMTYRSGTPGQPSSMHLVEAELDQRVAAGQVWESQRQCAEELEQWLRNAHPKAAPASAKTIKNRLGRKMPTARN
jgi:hypothetical protein